MDLIAHSKNDRGDYHLLLDHLKEVAKLTSEFSHKFGAGELGFFTGLWHDLGKCHPKFQAYLRDPAGNRGQDHKSAGAIFSLKYLEVLAFPIVAHHGGLPDYTNLLQRLNSSLKRKRIFLPFETREALKYKDRVFDFLHFSKLCSATFTEFYWR